jgi:DNA-binding winged helix-turn-helix (wHTH) protein/tetratricopeptide (TPR) repeat protein
MEVYKLGKWTIDPSAGTLTSDKEQRQIESKCMDLLILLIEAKGETVSREQIMTRLWNGRYVSDFALNNTVAQLRKHLSDGEKSAQAYIKTRHKRGYYLSTLPEVISASSCEPDKHRVFKRWPVAVLLSSILLITGLVFSFGNTDNIKQHKANIVVLPFSTNTNDDALFASGLVEEITHQLTNDTVFNIFAHRSQSLSAYSKEDVIALANDLHADYLIDGTVFKRGPIYKITVRLIDGKDASQLLSKVYMMNNQKLLAEYSRVASSLSSNLFQLFDTEDALSTVKESAIPREAYLHILNARKLNGSNTVKDYTAAIDEFKMAILLAPNYADAHAELSLNYLVLAQNTMRNQDEFNDNAWRSIETALSLDPSHPTALTGAAMYYQNLKEFERSSEFYQKAIAVEPNSYVAVLNYANLLREKHRFNESFDLYQQALAIAPSSAPANWAIGNILTQQGKLDEAIIQFEQCLTLLPNNNNCALGLSYALRLAHKPERADSVLQQFDPAFDKTNYWVKDALAWQAVWKNDNTYAFTLLDEFYPSSGIEMPSLLNYMRLLWDKNQLSGHPIIEQLNVALDTLSAEQLFALVIAYYLSDNCDGVNAIVRSTPFEEQAVTDTVDALLNGFSVQAAQYYCGKASNTVSYPDSLQFTVLDQLPTSSQTAPGVLFIKAQRKTLTGRSPQEELNTLKAIEWPLNWMLSKDPIIK